LGIFLCPLVSAESKHASLPLSSLPLFFSLGRGGNSLSGGLSGSRPLKDAFFPPASRGGDLSFFPFLPTATTIFPSSFYGARLLFFLSFSFSKQARKPFLASLTVFLCVRGRCKEPLFFLSPFSPSHRLFSPHLFFFPFFSRSGWFAPFFLLRRGRRAAFLSPLDKKPPFFFFPFSCLFGRRSALSFVRAKDEVFFGRKKRSPPLFSPGFFFPKTVYARNGHSPLPSMGSGLLVFFPPFSFPWDRLRISSFSIFFAEDGFLPVLSEQGVSFNFSGRGLPRNRAPELFLTSRAQGHDFFFSCGGPNAFPSVTCLFLKYVLLLSSDEKRPFSFF